jgi:hypothetical protein
MRALLLFASLCLYATLTRAAAPPNVSFVSVAVWQGVIAVLGDVDTGADTPPLLFAASRDGGATWASNVSTPADPTAALRELVAGGDQLYAAAEPCALWSSTDGLTWLNASLDRSCGDAVDMADSLQLVAGKLVVGSDRGIYVWQPPSWSKVRFGDGIINGVAASARVAVAVSGLSPQPVYFSSDGGLLSWQQPSLPTEMQGAWLFGVVYAAQLGRFFACGCDSNFGALVAASPDGANWQSVYSTTETETQLLAIAYVPWGGGVLVAGGATSLLLSADGMQWVAVPPQSLPTNATELDVQQIAVDAASQSIYVLGSVFLWRSSDAKHYIDVTPSSM